MPIDVRNSTTFEEKSKTFELPKPVDMPPQATPYPSVADVSFLNNVQKAGKNIDKVLWVGVVLAIISVGFAIFKFFVSN